MSDAEAKVGPPTAVMVLIPTLDVGGAEIDLVRNLPLIDRSRFKVTVCAFLGLGTLAQQLRAAGIEVIGPLQREGRAHALATRLASTFPEPSSSLAKRLAWRIDHSVPDKIRRNGRRFARRLMLMPLGGWFHLRLAIKIAMQIRERKIDVLHAILPLSYVVGGIACLLTKRPALVMSRVSLNWYQSWIFRIIEQRLLHPGVDLAICNSFAIEQNLRAEGVPPEKIRIIRNGIEIAGFSSIDRKWARDRLGISADALVLTVVANFYPYKGHADLLHALHIARPRLPPHWVLLAAGRDIDGNLNRMRHLCDQLGLSKHVRLLGERDDVSILLRASDVHVSASHTEGFPNNILEAMGASLPVIATAAGGVSEMIIDGVTGVLVPVQNVDEMARGLVMLAADPDKRKSMGEAGRARVVCSYSIEHSAKALQDSYEQVADGRRG